MKKIIFRADGNSTSGLGHLYRIFALIEIYRTKFEYVLLTKENSTRSAIPSEYKHQLIPDFISALEEPEWLSKNYPASNHLIIADGYQFDAVYQKAIKKNNYKLIYIDDQIKEKMYADVVINHALSVKVTDYRSETYTKFALGTSYAILRPLFLEAAKRSRKIEYINTAFVCFGGADTTDLTCKATKALLNTKAITKINVVIGAAYKHIEIIELEKKNSHLNVFQNLSESELVKIMEQCNFAVAPSSNILYELCSIKMPVLSGYYVENQKNIYKGCLENGCIIGAGDFLNYSVKDFEEQIKKVLLFPDLQKYVTAQSNLFDAQIKDRFLDLLSPVYYRKANESDMMVLYNWSNEKVTRANSYFSEAIPIETHKKWFDKKLKDERSVIYIAEVEGKPAGMVRYDSNEKGTVVGVIVDEEYRGKGLASSFLEDTAALYFKTSHLPIYAYIKLENKSSKRAFEKANYEFVDQELVHNVMSYVYKLEKK